MDCSNDLDTNCVSIDLSNFKGYRLINIRYIDDTALLGNCLQELQDIRNINQVGKQYGLKINVKKTKFMIISSVQHADASLKINNEQVQRVNRFKYFRNVLDDKCDDDVEIKYKVDQTKTAYQKMRRTF